MPIRCYNIYCYLKVDKHENPSAIGTEPRRLYIGWYFADHRVFHYAVNPVEVLKLFNTGTVVKFGEMAYDNPTVETMLEIEQFFHLLETCVSVVYHVALKNAVFGNRLPPEGGNDSE